MNAPDVLMAGRYRLVRRIGTGGMGIVWEAWDERLRRPVALKQLRQQPGLSEAETEVANNRAMREARITARLHHPHAVPVFDVVEHEGQPCLIMQYLPSRSLHAILDERGALPPGEVARIGAQVASALAAAHRVGIVHRDVKPGNVLVTEDGTAKISDFGISHALGDVTLTSAGMVTGTPAYLSPEVARGQESSFASDVFSLGATLYAAVEGTPPFGTDQNAMALLHRVAAGQVTPPVRSGQLGPLLLRMLNADPERRPPMSEVARTLAAFPPDDVADGAPTVAGAGAVAGAAGSPGVGAAAGAAADPDAPTVLAAASPAATQRINQLPGSGGEQPPGAGEPPYPEPDERDRRQRRPLAIVAAAVLLVLAILLAIVLFVRGGAATPGSDPSPSTRVSVPAPAPTVPGSASPTSPAPSSPTSPAPSSSPPPSSPPPSSPPPSSPPPSSPPPSSPPPSSSPQPSSPPAGAPTAGQLSQAIVSYYALLPGNTDAGWARLTQKYQVTTPKDRQTYQRFWDAISRVTVSSPSGTPPGTALATITYYFKDGRVVQERTSYGLVVDNGVLKIDTSDVLSSQ